MKTAISLPDEIFEAADGLAARLHVSRSQLYVMALEKLLKEHDQSDITRRLNESIDAHGQAVDPVFMDMSRRGLLRTEW